jgi:hypothetical protein
MQTTHIKLSLNQLTCHQHPEGWTYSEPYLWNIFFKIDGSCIRINNKFFLEGKPVYHFSQGSHGNLHAKDMNSGETIAIPKEVGEWRTPLVPLHVPYFESGISGLMGVVCVLMEQNYVSSKGAEAGHTALNEGIKGFIDSAIAQFDPKRVDLNDINGSIKKFYEGQAAEFSRNIGDMVGQAVAKSQSLVQNIFSLVNKDAVIGFKVFDFSASSITDPSGEMHFKNRWTTRKDGDWEIKGSIQSRKEPELVTAAIKRKSKEEEE